VGINLDLYQTLDPMFRNRESVTMWGPFVVRKVVYDKSHWIQQIIASGAPKTRRSARRGIC
jgi:hypothetical protein